MGSKLEIFIDQTLLFHIITSSFSKFYLDLIIGNLESGTSR